MRAPNTCSWCHELGHIARTCELAQAAGPVARLSAEQFDQLKAAWQEKGVTSADLAKGLGLPLREVNAALPAPHYEGYLLRRRKATMV